METSGQALDVIAKIVMGCALLHSFLPPWEILEDFPRTQKFYKVLVYTVGYIGLKARSTIYPVLSTKNGSQTSKAANGWKDDGDK